MEAGSETRTKKITNLLITKAKYYAKFSHKLVLPQLRIPLDAALLTKNKLVFYNDIYLFLTIYFFKQSIVLDPTPNNLLNIHLHHL